MVKEEDGLMVDVFIFKKDPFKVIKDTVNLDKTDEYKPDEGNKYDLNKEKMSHKDGKPCFIFRAGNPEPKTWKRFDGKFKPEDFHTIRHEETTLEGIANMLGIAGASSLNKKQWAIIIGVGVLAALAFFILRPKIMNMIGM